MYYYVQFMYFMVQQSNTGLQISHFTGPRRNDIYVCTNIICEKKPTDFLSSYTTQRDIH